MTAAQPPVVSPMLTGAARLPVERTGWLVEPKWDGVRAIVTVDADTVRLVSRNGNDISAAYPELAVPPAGLRGRRAVLDSEVVAFDDHGVSSFGRLQQRMHVRRPTPALVAAVPVICMVFDVLWLDGRSLLGLPQRQRRDELVALALGPSPWLVSPVLDLAVDNELIAVGRELGLEGFVLKRAAAPYLPGRRSDAWVKLKCRRQREFVVGGWLGGQGGRAGSVGSLALGVWDVAPAGDGGVGDRAGRRLRFVGMAGSGLGRAEIDSFDRLADQLGRADSPFAGPTPRGLRFLDPVIVAEVAFTEITAAGTLRHPVLLGFRTDLDPDEVVIDAELAELGGPAPAVTPGS